MPALSSYAGRLWDWWERHLDPDRLKERSLQAALNGRTVLITGASSGIGKATALKVAAAGGIPLLVARGTEKLEEVKQEIEAEGGSAYVYSADLSNLDSIDELVAQVLADHAAVDMLVNNAGRSIRRSVALSYERFHDYERTIQLNYLGSVKLIMGLLPPMRARGSGHIVNISSIGVQTEPATLLRLRRLQGRARCLHARRVERGARRRRDLHHDPHAAGAHADDRSHQDV